MMELIFKISIVTAIVVINFLAVALIGATLAGIYKTFQKMGLNGWEGLTPFWNLYKIYDLCFSPGKDRSMKALIVLFFAVTCMHHSFTHSELVSCMCTFTESVLLIFGFIEMMEKFDTDYPLLWAFGLFFLAPIFWPALGFGDMKFNKIKLVIDNSENDTEGYDEWY